MKLRISTIKTHAFFARYSGNYVKCFNGLDMKKLSVFQYFVQELDEDLSGEPITLKVLDEMFSNAFNNYHFFMDQSKP